MKGSLNWNLKEKGLDSPTDPLRKGVWKSSDTRVRTNDFGAGLKIQCEVGRLFFVGLLGYPRRRGTVSDLTRGLSQEKK